MLSDMNNNTAEIGEFCTNNEQLTSSRIFALLINN